MSKQNKKIQLKEKLDKVIFDWLQVKYPNLFNVENPKPLECGTSQLLQKELPENISLQDFKISMTWYCSRKRYLKAIISCDHRYDLNGEAIAEVIEDDKISATQRLEAIRKKLAAKKSKLNMDAVEQAEFAEIKPEEPMVIAVSVSISEANSELEEIKPKKTLSLKSKKTSTTMEEPKIMTTTSSKSMAIAKGLKVTLVLDPASLPDIDTTGMKKVPLSIFISNGEITAKTEINAKSYRKALSSIEEYGVDGCNAIIQGSMKKYGVIDDAGLVVQSKKQANAE